MPSATDRSEFAPPPQPAMLRAIGLALLAHLLLLAALTWGVRWNRQSEDMAVEAELWASVPRQAAPKLVEPPPPPPTPQREVQKPPEPVNRDADIALERQKKREAEQLEREQQERIAAQKKKAAERRAEERAQELAKKKQLEEEQRKDQLLAKRKEAQQARQLEEQRQKNLERIAGMAGAKGGPSDRGNVIASAGPSDSYGGRVRARVKPNIVFTENIAGNPTAEVEVRTSPDGTIVARKLVKSSGIAAWDDAVLKAIDKTEVLPRDVDGRVPSPMVIAFRPTD